MSAEGAWVGQEMFTVGRTRDVHGGSVKRCSRWVGQEMFTVGALRFRMRVSIQKVHEGMSDNQFRGGPERRVPRSHEGSTSRFGFS